MSLPQLREIPSGSLNGVNPLFTMNQFPFPSRSLHLYYNGQLMIQEVDYFISGTTILFVVPPVSGELEARFRSCNEDCATVLGVIGLAQSGNTSTGNFIQYEIPPEPANGVNTVFNLSATPVSGSLRFYDDGQLLVVGATEDYLIVAATITTNAPAVSGNVYANFRLSGDVVGLALTEENFVNHETPVGIVNGINDTFYINEVPLPGSLELYRNGQLLIAGSSLDYTLDENEITMAAAPFGKLWAHYQRPGVLGGNTLAEANFIDNETPGGSINGINNSFTLASPPSSGSVQLYHEGIQLAPVFDFTISGINITTVVPPTGNLRAYYRI
jgi:hypothetical protein